MKIELHRTLGIYLILDQIVEEKTFIRPTAVDASHRPQDYQKIIETQTKYYIREVQNEQGIILAQKHDVVDFMEVINGYLSKLLEDGKIYEFDAELGDKSTLQIKSKTNKQTEALKLELEKFYLEFYLKKIDCRIIYSKFMRAYSKCADIGFEVSDYDTYY